MFKTHWQCHGTVASYSRIRIATQELMSSAPPTQTCSDGYNPSPEVHAKLHLWTPLNAFIIIIIIMRQGAFKGTPLEYHQGLQPCAFVDHMFLHTLAQYNLHAVQRRPSTCKLLLPHERAVEVVARAYEWQCPRRHLVVVPVGGILQHMFSTFSARTWLA